MKIREQEIEKDFKRLIQTMHTLTEEIVDYREYIGDAVAEFSDEHADMLFCRLSLSGARNLFSNIIYRQDEESVSRLSTIISLHLQIVEGRYYMDSVWKTNRLSDLVSFVTEETNYIFNDLKREVER